MRTTLSRTSSFMRSPTTLRSASRIGARWISASTGSESTGGADAMSSGSRASAASMARSGRPLSAKVQSRRSTRKTAHEWIECVELPESLVRDTASRCRGLPEAVPFDDRARVCLATGAVGVATKTASSSASMSVRLECVPLLPRRNPARAAPGSAPAAGKNAGASLPQETLNIRRQTCRL